MEKKKGSILGPTFQYGCEGREASLADNPAVQARLAAKWDIKLLSVKTEPVSTWDKEEQRLVNTRPVVIITMERNVAAEVSRRAEHYAEVYKAAHIELGKIPVDTAVSVKVLNSDGSTPSWLTRGYVQTAYEVHTLGKYQKASPEVEALVADATEATAST